MVLSVYSLELKARGIKGTGHIDENWGKEGVSSQDRLTRTVCTLS